MVTRDTAAEYGSQRFAAHLAAFERAVGPLASGRA
jgi:predicted glycosyl hydrolase (DUF1957 family)